MIHWQTEEPVPAPRLSPAGKEVLPLPPQRPDETVASRYEALIAASDAVLARDPFNVPALYDKARACARLGRDDAARAIIRLDEQVTVLEPRLPVADAAAFRSALAEEIRRQPSLVHKAVDRATREGAQTREPLLYPGAVHLRILFDTIRAEIDRHVEAMAANDPFIGAAPARARINAWAVVYGKGGHQAPHWHRDGWMSGVFYVTGKRHAAGEDYEGPLLVGPYAEDFRGHKPPWGIRKIAPVPGRLVLFPSFVPHRTLPAQTAGERISVAFDVVPD